MKVALIYPPACDPTAPYLAVPALAAYLRLQGIDVIAIDANIEAFDGLLTPESMGAVRDRIESRIARLERKPSLGHADQLTYAALWSARGDASSVSANIGRATATLRDPERFFDVRQYSFATAAIDGALRSISAAYHPLNVDFVSYSTPFGLTSPQELAASAQGSETPFDAYLEQVLIPRLRAENVRVVGLSICMPGQLHPGYIFATRIRKALPGVHLTVGGPGITQSFVRLSQERMAAALGPFESAVLFEGEHTLVSLVRALEKGSPLAGIDNVAFRDGTGQVQLQRCSAPVPLGELPAPDFDGLPLQRYLSPRLVLPYDPTRGCYWGRCAFCHYGLAEKGTAAYRERDATVAAAHLQKLAERYDTPYFYLSHDSIAPKTLVELARQLSTTGTQVRWATDLKPERYLTAERGVELRRGGAIACALGVESGSNRILSLIHKGTPVEGVAEVIGHLAGAGIAVEAMCFSGFPTETYEEALQTIRFVHRHRKQLSTFIVGEFGLTHGSIVAQDPARFDIRETWQVDGDMLGLALFFEPKRQWKIDDDLARLEDEIAKLSSRWALRPYPWAGAVSTAHSILYYDRLGPGAFRGQESVRLRTETAPRALPKFDLAEAQAAVQRDAEIWQELIQVVRSVTRERYNELAAELPLIYPRTLYPPGDAMPSSRRRR